MAAYEGDLNITGDGNTSAVQHPGGSGAFGAAGTFGGGTLTMEISFDGGTTWVDVLDSAMTADDVYAYALPACLIRGNLSGASTPDIDIFVRAMQDVS